MSKKPCKDCIHKEACITANADMVKKTHECKYHISVVDVSEFLSKKLNKPTTDVFNAIIEFRKMKGDAE